MDLLYETLFNGLAIGSVLVLAALGLAVVFGLMGVINIEPKEILVEGLRKQLCQTVAKMLHDAFIFTAQVGTVKTNVDHSKQGAMG